MDKDDVKVLLIAIGLVIALLLVTTVFAIGITYMFDKPACSTIEIQSGYPTKFEFFGGCFIQIDNTWIPLDNWRYIEE